MEGQRSHDDQRVAQEVTQEPKAESGGEVENKRAHAKWRDLHHEMDEGHGGLVDGFQKLQQGLCLLLLDADHAQAEKHGEEHHAEKVPGGGRLNGVVRHEREEALREIDAVAGRQGGYLAGFDHGLTDLHRKAVARAEHIDGDQAGENGEARDQQGKSQRPYGHASELCRVAHLGHAQDEGADHQRQHRHKQQAQEQAPEGLGGEVEEKRQAFGRGREGAMQDETGASPDHKADEDLSMERHGAILQKWRARTPRRQTRRAPPRLVAATAEGLSVSKHVSKIS